MKIKNNTLKLKNTLTKVNNSQYNKYTIEKMYKRGCVYADRFFGQ